jgi:hypothetical protein
MADDGLGMAPREDRRAPLGPRGHQQRELASPGCRPAPQACRGMEGGGPSGPWRRARAGPTGGVTAGIPPGLVMFRRTPALGAKTPWYLVTWTRGGGMRADRRR